jgi:hypothetical protein
LVVISPSTPTGPRAWILAVLIPTSAPVSKNAFLCYVVKHICQINSKLLKTQPTESKSEPIRKSGASVVEHARAVHFTLKLLGSLVWKNKEINFQCIKNFTLMKQVPNLKLNFGIKIEIFSDHEDF